MAEDPVATLLRDVFVDELLATDAVPKGMLKTADYMRSLLCQMDKLCDSAVAMDNPAHAEMALRALQGALIGAGTVDDRAPPVMAIFNEYIRARAALVQLEQEPAFQPTAPCIIVPSFIIPGDKTKEGLLVEGVGTLWFEIVRRIREDPDFVYNIECWDWEKLIAGAYKQEGWETVVLTPRKGDKGIDVIATRADWGQIRFLLLHQMKAYAPDHLVGPDEVREMLGVLHTEHNATKAIISTTSAFTSGAIDAAKEFDPRLELKAKDKLLAWLASLMVKTP